jgi:hypothetical protein
MDDQISKETFPSLLALSLRPLTLLLDATLQLGSSEMLEETCKRVAILMESASSIFQEKRQRVLQ